MCSACKTQIITPAIVPPVEIEAPQPAPTSHSLGIIGAVEPVYVLPMKMPFAGRIDTGAETSSIDASDIKTFERDGEKWVSFTIVNRETGEKHRFEKNWPARRQLPASTSTKNAWSSIWTLSSAMK